MRQYNIHTPPLLWNNKKQQRRAITVSFLLLCGFMLTAGCQTEPLESGEGEEVIPVETSTVYEESFSERIELSGRIRSQQEFPVVLPSPAKAADVFVELGDYVVQGQPVMRLVGADQIFGYGALFGESRGEAGEPAGNQQLDSTADQARMLLDAEQTGAVTMLELEASRNILNNDMTNERRAADGTAAETGEGQIIVAPFDGVVTLLNVRPGSLAIADVPIIQLSNMEDLSVDLRVGSSQIDRLEKGMRAFIWLEHAEEPIEARLDALSPAAAAEQHFYQARIDLEHEIENEFGNVYPGMMARVEVETLFVENALLIPVESVFFQEEEAYVYTVENDRARLTSIELGGRNATDYHVLSGLEKGDRVITLGRDRLTDGSRVYVPFSD